LKKTKNINNNKNSNNNNRLSRTNGHLCQLEAARQNKIVVEPTTVTLTTTITTITTITKTKTTTRTTRTTTVVTSFSAPSRTLRGNHRLLSLIGCLFGPVSVVV
jgi:carbohydrate-binding DOMON domain-containing protein